MKDGGVYLETSQWQVFNEYCVIISDGTNPIRVPAPTKKELCFNVHSILGLSYHQEVRFTNDDTIKADNEHYIVHHYLVARKLVARKLLEFTNGEY
jgi:hypothetical protein